MSELYVVPNAEQRPCRGCGEVHPHLSNGSGGRPCDTPAVFTRQALEQMDGFPTFMGGTPVAVELFPGPHTGMSRAEAIAYMEHARDVHQDWINLYAYCETQSKPWSSQAMSSSTGRPLEPVEHEGGGLKDCATCLRLAATAGASEHHKTVVDAYNGVIAVLRTAPEVGA